MDSRLEHPLKVSAPMFSTVLGNSKVISFEQFLKAELPISFSPLLKVTLSSDVQFSKQSRSIVLMFEGIVICFSPLSSNMPKGSVLMLLGSCTEARFLQQEKMVQPSVVTLLGIVTVAMAVL